MHTILKSTVAASFLVLLCVGCGGDDGLRTTTPPLPPPIATTGRIRGFVVEGGGCISDALVEIVEGPGTGQKVVQKGGCSAWDDEGYDTRPFRGFEFNDLPLGVTIRLRATKEGYQPKEFETMAVTGGTALVIVLKKE